MQCMAVRGAVERLTPSRLVVAVVAACCGGAWACAPSVRLVPTPSQRSCMTIVQPDGTRVTEGSDAPQNGIVAWFTPDSERDRQSLDRACETVGPVVANFTLTRAAAATPNVDLLAVLTWNLHVGTGDLSRLVHELRAGRLTNGEPVVHFVLLLQEAYRSWAPSAVAPALPAETRDSRHRDTVRLAKIEGLYVYYVPTVHVGDGVNDATRADHRNRTTSEWRDRGNAIVSTMPLTELHAIELPFERQRRLAIAATIHGATRGDAPWTLRLVNVHLENRAGRRRWWMRSRAARLRQVEALVKAIPRDGAIILGGDLNPLTAHDEPGLRTLREVFQAWDEEDRRATFRWGLRLDYLFKRLPAAMSMEYRRCEHRYGSDHYPLLGLLRLAPATL
jgi:endonuclease/exonuclease/phosphatase family metal-dependent hydrolase